MCLIPYSTPKIYVRDGFHPTYAILLIVIYNAQDTVENKEKDYPTEKGTYSSAGEHALITTCWMPNRELDVAGSHVKLVYWRYLPYLIALHFSITIHYKTDFLWFSYIN